MRYRNIREIAEQIMAVVPAKYTDKLLLFLTELPTEDSLRYKAPEQLTKYWGVLSEICNIILNGEYPLVTDWKIKMISILADKTEEGVLAHDHTEKFDYEDIILQIPDELKGKPVLTFLNLTTSMNGTAGAKYELLYSRPFNKKHIEKYFENWVLDKEETYTNYTVYHAEQWCNIYFTKGRFTVLVCRHDNGNNVVMQGLTPKTLDEFILIMLSCGVELVWKKN